MDRLGSSNVIQIIIGQRLDRVNQADKLDTRALSRLRSIKSTLEICRQAFGKKNHCYLQILEDLYQSIESILLLFCEALEAY